MPSAPPGPAAHAAMPSDSAANCSLRLVLLDAASRRFTLPKALVAPAAILVVSAGSWRIT